jgi:hypothetical protein
MKVSFDGVEGTLFGNEHLEANGLNYKFELSSKHFLQTKHPTHDAKSSEIGYHVRSRPNHMVTLVTHIVQHVVGLEQTIIHGKQSQSLLEFIQSQMGHPLRAFGVYHMD